LAAATSLSTRVSAEESTRLAADSSIALGLSAEKSRIDAILIGASASADNFAEIVTLINSVDTTNDQAFAGYVLSNDAALSTEVSRAQSAEASILAAGSAAMSAEISSRISGDSSLEESLSYNISSEISSRISGDDSLDAKFSSAVSSEISRAESAEASLASSLSASISNNSSAEESRAMSAEASLDSALSAEISRATSVENNLDALISDVISNADVTKIDSFVETINEFNTMIENNFDSIYAKKNTSTQVPGDGAVEFPFVNHVKPGSEQVYLNGLLMSEDDYSVNLTSGLVSGITFATSSVPVATDKVMFYGVYGSFDSVVFQPNN
jgi:hypothetical protein